MTERITVEHYVGKCLLKCTQVILGSRVYQDEDQRPPVDKRAAQWFLLEIDELAGVSARLEPWVRDVYAPLVIEIYIHPWDTSSIVPTPAAAAVRQGTNALTTGTAGTRTLLERWTLNYTAGSSSAATSSSGRPVMEPAAVYKRLILLVRSLYSYVRVLPGYRLYRACKRHGRDLFNTSYNLSTTPLPLLHPQQQQLGLADRRGSSSSRMQQFSFSPVETMFGVFSIGVEYQPATTVHLLEQTTVLPCQPRIIADYVDGPYAKSAPDDRVSRVAASSSIGAAAAAGRAGDDTGTPGVLRSSHHQGPLVRHSWSSKDIPVIQRGFSPPARTLSLTSGHAAAGGSSAAAGNAVSMQQQQQPVLLRRSLSQGYGSSVESPRAAAAKEMHSGSFSSRSNSPMVHIGPSSVGRPPLPHSAAAAAASAAGGSQLLSNNASGSAAAALPPASPGTPSSGNARSLGSSLLRSLSANAAAAASAAAAAAAAAASGIASSAPGHGAGLHNMAVQQLSRLGSSFGSASGSPFGSGNRVLGFGMQRQQQQQQTRNPMHPQATQQGFHVKSSGSISDKSLDANAQHGTVALPAEAEAGRSTHDQQQQGLLQDDSSDLNIQMPVVAVAESTEQVISSAEVSAGIPSCRVVSAPMTIPSRSKGRARSVTDLPLMAAAAAAEAAGDPTAAMQGQEHALPHQTAGANDSTCWQQQQQQRKASSRGLGGLSAAVLSGGQQQQSGGGSSSSLLQLGGIQQQNLHQQLVQAPSSAPAAPRGMLGQLLSGSSTTSPSVSPPYNAAAAASRRPAAAVGQQQGDALAASDNATSSIHDAEESSKEDNAPAAGAAAGRSNAIIIRPQYPYQCATAAAASPSPSPGSRYLHLEHNRMLSSGLPAGFSVGTQPLTPGGPLSILSCSPQLPFAFTPSAASLGTSLLSITDQQKAVLGGTAAAAAKGQGRPGGGAAAAAPGGSAAVGSVPAAAGSSHSSGIGVNIGTPSPPLHVSCVRDITGLATIRRPSWSSRSSSFDVAASASLPRHLSISPLGDLLDPALLGCSGSNSSGHGLVLSAAARQSGAAAAAGGGGAPRPAAAGACMTPAVVLPGGFGSIEHGDAAAATATAAADNSGVPLVDGTADANQKEDASPATAAVADGSMTAVEATPAADTASLSVPADDALLGSVMPDESESDILPFAIDTEVYAVNPSTAATVAAAGGGYVGSSTMHALCRQQQQQQHVGNQQLITPGRQAAAGAGANPEQRDVAVGAFVKLIQEAAGCQFTRCSKPQQHQQQQHEESAAGHVGQHQMSVADALHEIQEITEQLHMLVYPDSN